MKDEGLIALLGAGYHPLSISLLQGERCAALLLNSYQRMPSYTASEKLCTFLSLARWARWGWCKAKGVVAARFHLFGAASASFHPFTLSPFHL
jgi:hypothetical protein